MKILHCLIIGITVFCAITFFMIQSNLIFQCKPNPNEYAPMQFNQCEDLMQNLKVILGLSASAGITAIVCMIIIISPKKSIILVMSIASSLVLLFVLRHAMFDSIDPPGMMHQVGFSYVLEYNFAASPLWNYVLFALVYSAVAWPIVFLRKKILKRIR